MIIKSYKTKMNGRYQVGSGRIVTITHDSPFIEDNNISDSTESQDDKKSSRDSEDNTLSEQQAEYFKDSKVRDADGNLLVVYHGTPNATFTVFRPGTYFTENKWYDY